jgi:hypothetical protein
MAKFDRRNLGEMVVIDPETGEASDLGCWIDLLSAEDVDALRNLLDTRPDLSKRTR